MYIQFQFDCCGVNNTVDWFERNLNFTIANGNSPPKECICEVDKDDNCMQFEITITDPTSESNTTATIEAWDRVA